MTDRDDCDESASMEEQLRLRLHPLTMTATLMRASILITSYELLKVEVVDPIRDFFADTWTAADGTLESDTYQREVLTRPGNRIEKSLGWLRDAGALDDDQVDAVSRLHAERLRVAHELARYMVDPSAEIDVSLIDEVTAAAIALGRFWGAINADTDPAFDDVDVDYAGIRSGVALLIEHLGTIARLADTLASMAAKDLAGELDFE